MFSGFPYDAEVAVVEIDPATGFLTILKYVSVHDCGTVLNPRIVEGQHLGALAHGIGGALYEELRYDENGQLLNKSFMDYFVPTVMEIPDCTLDHLVSPSPFTPGGFKGAGETGTIGPPACLANAVEDALRPLGAKIRTLPLSPDFLWRSIQEARDARPA
jgi:CO/xanthine dehydrogenase Mo-binding subunit